MKRSISRRYFLSALVFLASLAYLLGKAKNNVEDSAAASHRIVDSAPFGALRSVAKPLRNKAFSDHQPCRGCFSKRKGSGVLFFVYGLERRTFTHFAEQVISAAGLMKTLSPSVQLAIATSYDHQGFDLFDIKIKIRDDHHFPGSNYENREDGHKRQYLTRILYMSATPFEVTLAVDTNIITCGSVLPALSKLETSEFDIAVASTGAPSSLSTDIHPHNFAIAFRWNEKTATFFDEWFIEQVIAGVALNDQGTLHNAAKTVQRRVPAFSFKVLNPAFTAAYACTEPSVHFFPRETRVIRGHVVLIHGNPQQAKQFCEIFNVGAPTARQIVTLKGWPQISVYSSAECADKLEKRTSCRYDKLWNDIGEENLVPTRLA